MLPKRIVIMPPLAFARFGSHSKPMANYRLEPRGFPMSQDQGDFETDDLLGYRRIVPEETLWVEPDGSIRAEAPDGHVKFHAREANENRVHPVAPFFELWGEFERNIIRPITCKDLDGENVEWRVEVANWKVYRRTGDKRDQVSADTCWFSDHAVHELRGKSTNFVPGGYVDFGSVRFIKAKKDTFNQIRLRFTPGAGRIYGPVGGNKGLDEPFLARRDIYKAKKKHSWQGWQRKPGAPPETVPSALFAIMPPAPSWLHGDKAISRGYLDEACDGFIRARIGKLEAKARIGVAPPHYAPDSLFVRSLLDDLQQAIEGPEMNGETRAYALDIVRRAFETVRFMNVAVMNGNDYAGREGLALDSMAAEEAFDIQRPLQPVIPPKGADTAAILALHQRVYAALSSGTAGWFAQILRRPDQVGDLTDTGRRKMPALMSGADNLYLALTHRQISAIEKAAARPSSGHGGKKAKAAKDEKQDPDATPRLDPRNKTALLTYKITGNPISSHPITAVGNCCPGLEFDFRAVWRRLFKGITLVEHDNLVVDAEAGFKHLLHRRLLKIGGRPVVTRLSVAKTSDSVEAMFLTKDGAPDFAVTMEWSNNLAAILPKAGKLITCVFSEKMTEGQQCEAWNKERAHKYVRAKLRVREFFEKETAVISEELAKPGELTQGLCSPWQNDFRECSCYYWASSRPDFVNTSFAADGTTRGHNWMQMPRTNADNYIPDDYQDSRLILYDDLFRGWENILKFQVGGKDVK